jgi:hypothetical protein
MFQFQWSLSLEMVSYVIFLLILWIIVRFLATALTNFLKNFGDQPIKVEPFLNGVKYAVSYWTERGGRPYQEDRHQVIKGIGAEDSSLYGVFDGHGKIDVTLSVEFNDLLLIFSLQLLDLLAYNIIGLWFEKLSFSSGGYKAAQYCKDFLLQCIVKDSEFAKNPANAVRRSFFK